MSDRAPPPRRELRSGRRGPVRLADLVPGQVAPVLQRRGFVNATVLAEWPEIVGAEIARWTRPIEIRWPRKSPEGAAPEGPAPSAKASRATHAVLVIACPGAFALDLQMGTAGIVEAINRRLGYGCIGGIEIRQVPRPAPVRKAAPPEPDPAAIARAEETLSDISDPDLRQSMARFAAAIAARSEVTIG